MHSRAKFLPLNHDETRLILPTTLWSKYYCWLLFIITTVISLDFFIWSWLYCTVHLCYYSNNWTCGSMIKWNKYIHIIISSWLSGTKLPKPQWTLRTERYQTRLGTFKSAEIQTSLTISYILQAITSQGKNLARLYQQIHSFSLFSLRS